MSSKIGEFEIVDHGIEHSQYFQGCGTSLTRFENVATGIGDNFSEAIDDCLEQIATGGTDTEGMETRILVRVDYRAEKNSPLSLPVSPSVSDSAETSETETGDSETGDDESESETGDDESAELFYHVSIRWNERAETPLGKLDQFTRAYLECALWSSTGDDSEPLDKHYEFTDIAAETLAQAIADCAAFQAAHWDDIAEHLEQSGHDFWLTRCGHGAGFWDRGYGAKGERLTAASKVYGNVDLIVGDDGKIY